MVSSCQSLGIYAYLKKKNQFEDFGMHPLVRVIMFQILKLFKR